MTPPIPESKYKPGQYVYWAAPLERGGTSGDGVIIKARYRISIGDESAGWFYAIGSVYCWVREELIQRIYP